LPTTLYAAIWDHKNGQDMTIHATEKSALTLLVKAAKIEIKNWIESSEERLPFCNMSDKDLLESWGEITGWNEFMTIEPHALWSLDEDSQ